MNDDNFIRDKQSSCYKEPPKVYGDDSDLVPNPMEFLDLQTESSKDEDILIGIPSDFRHFSLKNIFAYIEDLRERYKKHGEWMDKALPWIKICRDDAFYQISDRCNCQMCELARNNLVILDELIKGAENDNHNNR